MSCSKMQFFLVYSAKFMLRRNGVCRIDVQPCLQSPYDDNYSRLEGFDVRRVKNPELCIELFKKFWNRVLLQKLEIHFVPPPPGAPVKKRKKSPYSKSRSEGNGGLIGIPNCNVTEALMELFGENVDIEVDITKLKGDDDDDEYGHDHNDFYNHYYSNSNSSDDSKEYSIHLRLPLLKGEKYACVDNEFPTDIDPLCNYLEDYYQEYEGERLSHLDSGLEGKISVGVIVKNIDYITFAAEVPHEKMAVNKKILQEEVESDLVIIPGTGNPVKGHRIFLAAHSTVFKVMFQPRGHSGHQAEVLTLEMKEMTEESVRALLAYLYYWDQTEANSKPAVACELLNAGRKYEVPALETAMKKLLLSKEDKWFDDVEVAVKFWLFAEDEKQLKTKAVQILKSNFSLSRLEASVTFQQLVNENPESPAALKLRKMFLEN